MAAGSRIPRSRPPPAPPRSPRTTSSTAGSAGAPARTIRVGPDPVGPDPVGPDPVGPDPVGTDPVGSAPVGSARLGTAGEAPRRSSASGSGARRRPIRGTPRARTPRTETVAHRPREQPGGHRLPACHDARPGLGAPRPAPPLRHGRPPGVDRTGWSRSTSSRGRRTLARLTVLLGATAFSVAAATAVVAGIALFASLDLRGRSRPAENEGAGPVSPRPDFDTDPAARSRDRHADRTPVGLPQRRCAAAARGVPSPLMTAEHFSMTASPMDGDLDGARGVGREPRPPRPAHRRAAGDARSSSPQAIPTRASGPWHSARWCTRPPRRSRRPPGAPRPATRIRTCAAAWPSSPPHSRDGASARALVALLGDGDPLVAEAAAFALGEHPDATDGWSPHSPAPRPPHNDALGAGSGGGRARLDRRSERTARRCSPPATTNPRFGRRAVLALAAFEGEAVERGCSRRSKTATGKPAKPPRSYSSELALRAGHEHALQALEALEAPARAEHDAFERRVDDVHG